VETVLSITATAQVRAAELAAGLTGYQERRLSPYEICTPA
jgi:hypothetical protein